MFKALIAICVVTQFNTNDGAVCSFSRRPRACSKGGILAEIPTYGKHLSHNVYYGRDYVR